MAGLILKKIREIMPPIVEIGDVAVFDKDGETLFRGPLDCVTLVHKGDMIDLHLVFEVVQGIETP